MAYQVIMALFDGCGGRVRRVRRERGEVRSKEDGWVCLDGLNRRIAQKPACPPSAGHLTSQTLASSLNINTTHIYTHTHTHTHKCTQDETAHTDSTAPPLFSFFGLVNRSSCATRFLPSSWVNAQVCCGRQIGAFPGRYLSPSLCISLALLVTYCTGSLPLKPARLHRKRGHPTSCASQRPGCPIRG